MLSIFKPASTQSALTCRGDRLRLIVDCAGKFSWGYSLAMRLTIWFVRTFALAMPYLVEQGFSRGDLGFALSGISIAYGFSKFIMGSVSDRSNPRVFLPAGLILAAAVMLFMGFVHGRRRALR